MQKVQIERVLAGDEKAQADFYKAHLARLYRTCVHLLGYQDPEAEDIVQEAFLKVLATLSPFDFSRDIHAWLNKICVNLCFKRLRQRQALADSEAAQLEALAKSLAAAGPLKKMEAAPGAHLSNLIQTQIHRLGRRSRQVIELRDRQGMSYPDMGRKLRASLGTVFSRLARCRQALKEIVKAETGGGR
jgi:RNA polymerase sigma-70 factor (ECF subfamily)